MRRKILFLIILQLIVLCSTHGQTDTILNRYREYLFRTNQPEADIVNKWSGTLDQNGQWPDINYNDTELAGWKLGQHLVRIKEMALAWSYKQSSLYHNKLLMEKIAKALDHWFGKRYQSANWWHNEIGVPRGMRDIIMLLREDLDPGRLQKAIEVMAQLRVHDDYVGGNLIWCADLGLHYGAITGDEELVNHCRDLILKEI